MGEGEWVGKSVRVLVWEVRVGQGSIKHFGSSMQNFDTSLLTCYKAMKYVDFLN